MNLLIEMEKVSHFVVENTLVPIEGTEEYI